jgi:hypothetical protein
VQGLQQGSIKDRSVVNLRNKPGNIVFPGKLAAGATLPGRHALGVNVHA